MEGAQVQSLVGELRSHLLCSVAKEINCLKKRERNMGYRKLGKERGIPRLLGNRDPRTAAQPQVGSAESLVYPTVPWGQFQTELAASAEEPKKGERRQLSAEMGVPLRLRRKNAAISWDGGTTETKEKLSAGMGVPLTRRLSQIWPSLHLDTCQHVLFRACVRQAFYIHEFILKFYFLFLYTI